MTDEPEPVDVVVIGGGPAGLSAALNLGRALASVLLIDTGRPRNAATLRSHGFLTRDGVPPIELRKLGVAELEQYPNVTVLTRSTVSAVEAPTSAAGARLAVTLPARGAAAQRRVEASAVLIATGLRETLPDVENLRAFYGMSVFSCIVCDGWELRDRPLALIGQTPDLVDRARLIARWTDRLTVFATGPDAVDAAAERDLADRGIRVERRAVAALEGEGGQVSAVRLADGDTVPVAGGFVRPLWHPALEFLDDIAVERDADGLIVADADGATSLPGLFAAGDVTSPGPQQLIVAAGHGARAAAAILRTL